MIALFAYTTGLAQFMFAYTTGLAQFRKSNFLFTLKMYTAAKSNGNFFLAKIKRNPKIGTLLYLSLWKKVPIYLSPHEYKFSMEGKYSTPPPKKRGTLEWDKKKWRVSFNIFVLIEKTKRKRSSFYVFSMFQKVTC